MQVCLKFIKPKLFVLYVRFCTNPQPKAQCFLNSSDYFAEKYYEEKIKKCKNKRQCLVSEEIPKRFFIHLPLHRWVS